MNNEDSYLGQLVVLQTKWNLRSGEIGIVVENIEKDVVMVMWTTRQGFELKNHMKQALLPVTEQSIVKVKERFWIFK